MPTTAMTRLPTGPMCRYWSGANRSGFFSGAPAGLAALGLWAAAERKRTAAAHKISIVRRAGFFMETSFIDSEGRDGYFMDSAGRIAKETLPLFRKSGKTVIEGSFCF